MRNKTREWMHADISTRLPLHQVAWLYLTTADPNCWLRTLMFDTAFIYWQNMGAIALFHPREGFGNPIIVQTIDNKQVDPTFAPKQIIPLFQYVEYWVSTIRVHVKNSGPPWYVHQSTLCFETRTRSASRTQSISNTVSLLKSHGDNLFGWPLSFFLDVLEFKSLFSLLTPN